MGRRSSRRSRAASLVKRSGPSTLWIAAGSHLAAVRRAPGGVVLRSIERVICSAREKEAEVVTGVLAQADVGRKPPPRSVS
jgi:hypothetical protein